MNEIETLPGHTAPSLQPAGFGRNWVRYTAYAALLLTVAFFAWTRFRLRGMPLERDEGEYAYIGQLMLQGIPPYKLASNMKLPGTYAAYAAIMAVFGETSAGIHDGMIWINAAATILVFLLTKYLYGQVAGSVAGATYAFLSVRPILLAIDGHATHFVVLAALAGTLLLLYAIDNDKLVLFLGCGLCYGTGFLMKQPGALFGLFAGLYLFWLEWNGPRLWKKFAARCGVLLAGSLLPFALTCLILWRVGVFANFWFWTWSYAREYGSITSLSHAAWVLGLILPWVVRPFAIWEIAAVGLTAPIWSRHARTHGGFVASFFLFSWLSVCPGLYFRPHYFILLLPAAAMCTGVGVEAVRLFFRERFPRLEWLPVFYFAVIFVIAVRGQDKTFFRMDPVALSHKMHEGQPYADTVAVADYIQAHSSPEDQIGIIGSEPQICFYTRLHCATGYLYMFPLMEKQKFARQMQLQMMQEIQSAHPRFLVYVDAERSWSWIPTLSENICFFEQAWNYAHTGYDLVQQVPIAGYPEHLWGDHAYLYVFRRKD